MHSDFLILLAFACVYNIRLFLFSLFSPFFSLTNLRAASVTKKGICTRNEYLHNVQLIMM